MNSDRPNGPLRCHKEQFQTTSFTLVLNTSVCACRPTRSNLEVSGTMSPRGPPRGGRVELPFPPPGRVESCFHHKCHRAPTHADCAAMPETCYNATFLKGRISPINNFIPMPLGWICNQGERGGKKTQRLEVTGSEKECGEKNPGASRVKMPMCHRDSGFLETLLFILSGGATKNSSRPGGSSCLDRVWGAAGQL